MHTFVRLLHCMMKSFAEQRNQRQGLSVLRRKSKRWLIGKKCINSFRVELDCDIYITGSNAKLLSGELATYLAGRYVEFVIYPFSFREFMELYHTVYEGADERQCFTKYLTLGGMPYLSNLRYDDAASRQYLRDLFNSVELKDIIKRNNIRDVDMLERIIAYITSNIGTTFFFHSHFQVSEK